jgi:murein DD-endopeptidase MepM/ murein hydrolase activator NlpD
MDFMNCLAEMQVRERQEYEATIVELKADLLFAETSLRDTETRYRDELMKIVTTVYEREFYSMGGYETPQGAEVTEIYQAILNEVRDYSVILREIGNYFDKRTEYLKEIPSVWPVEYSEFTCITSGFGWRLSPITGKVRFHRGIDISGDEGAKIIASAGGKVECWPPPDSYYHGDRSLGGKVIIEHAGGFKTVYGHLRKIFVHDGNVVKRGDVIGIMGNTGKSRGRHLHYEVLYNDKPVNPVDYLQF